MYCLSLEMKGRQDSYLQLSPEVTALSDMPHKDFGKGHRPSGQLLQSLLIIQESLGLQRCTPDVAVAQAVIVTGVLKMPLSPCPALS